MRRSVIEQVDVSSVADEIVDGWGPVRVWEGMQNLKDLLWLT